MPPSAEATIDERAFVRGDARRGTLDRLAVGERRAAELPHFQCVLTSLHDSTPVQKRRKHEDHEDDTKVTKKATKTGHDAEPERFTEKETPHEVSMLFVCVRVASARVRCYRTPRLSLRRCCHTATSPGEIVSA